jgi:antitoxin component YwqK of YwqJK toxin-antitoxin module
MGAWSESFETFNEDGFLMNSGITGKTPNGDGWYSGVMKTFNRAGRASKEQYLYKDGWYKFYGKYGKFLTREGRAVKGLTQGIWKFYREGNLYSEITYKDDIKNGPFKTYYENGKLRSEGSNKDAKLNGYFENYHENGKLAIKATFKDGLEEGVALSFYKNGNTRNKLTYRQGKKYGFSQEFYEEGLLAREGDYVLDAKDGVWKTHNREEEVSLETLFNMGEVVEYPCRSEFCPYVLLSFKGPIYPKKAFGKQAEGCVMMEFTLSKEGNPVEEKILWSKASSKKTKYLKDNIFNERALESLRTYKYRPKHIDGQAVEVPNLKNFAVFKIDAPGKSMDYNPEGCD